VLLDSSVIIGLTGAFSGLFLAIVGVASRRNASRDLEFARGQRSAAIAHLRDAEIALAEAKTFHARTQRLVERSRVGL